MNESKNICLSCGFCCDGTVVGFVQLEPVEIPAVREVMNIEESNDNGIFLQPCDNFCNGCTIYSKRPKQCASFKCDLLKSVEQKELEYDTAISMIDIVRYKKINLEEKIATLPFKLKSESFYFKMVELKKLSRQKESETLLNHQDLLTDLQQLNELLSIDFGVSFN